MLNEKEEEVMLSLYNNCIMGKYINQEKFIICFEYLSFEQISDEASKFKHGLIFFKNFEELKLFTNNEKVFKS